MCFHLLFVLLFSWLINGTVSFKQLLCIPMGDIMCIFMNLSWFIYFVLPPLYNKKKLCFSVRNFKYTSLKHRCFFWTLHKDCPLLQNASVGSAGKQRIICMRFQDPGTIPGLALSFLENLFDPQCSSGNRSLQK